MKGSKTVTTVAIEATPSIWTRAASRLSNWGSKIVGLVKKVGSWFAKGAKWLYNSTPVQWTIGKVVFGTSWVWHYAKGPILWVGLPLISFLVMPKVVAGMLFLVLLALIVIGFFMYSMRKHILSISSEEELADVWEGLVARLENVAEGQQTINGEAPLSFDNEPIAGETVADRLTYLDKMQHQAQNDGDYDKFSETQARMNLLIVRRGDVSSIKATAAANVVYQYCRRQAEKLDPDFAWNWRLMHRATLSESRRLKILQDQSSVVPIKK